MKRGKAVSVKDVAAAANVSPSTASVVLSNKGGEFRIAPETQQKVLQVAASLGYQPTRRAKKKTGISAKQLWCIFSPTNFDRGPTAQFFEGVNKYLHDHRLPIETIIFPFERGHLSEKAGWLSSGFTCGAMLTALNDEDMAYLQTAQFDIPIVLFNRTLHNFYSVTTDEYSTGRHAMGHFLSHGHRKISMIAPTYSSRSLSLRMVGFRDRLQSGSAKEKEASILPTRYGDDNFEGGFAAMQMALEGETRPTAVFVLNDSMVGGVVRAIQEKGLAIPGDIEIISNGNSSVNTLIFPSITSFAMPMAQMSYNCAKLLHNAVETGILSDNINRSYDAELVFRQSCPE